MSKQNYGNIVSSQDAAEHATKRAKDTLKAQGIFYPSLVRGESATDLLDRIDAYRIKESALIVEYLRMPSGARPISLDTTKPTNEKKWGHSYND